MESDILCNSTQSFFQILFVITYISLLYFKKDNLPLVAFEQGLFHRNTIKTKSKGRYQIHSCSLCSDTNGVVDTFRK